jgi:predicted acyl esterase
VTIDPARRVQALYVPVSDGVRLAVDVWLPVERIALGERFGTAFRATRYHRAELPPGPQPEADSNHAAGELWNSAGFALVVVDARGTGASFGSRTMELGPREIADYGELIDWVAAQPWSNGRVGLFGASYDGQAAELAAGLGNPHVTAVAALFSPVDPYRELFYPGGCATGGRFARWMCESQIKDGVAGAVERLSELTGRPAGEIAPPTPVKGVDGPDGPALLQAAIGEHQANVDMQKLLGRAAFSDDCLPGLDWQATTPVGVREAIEATGVPMLIRAGVAGRCVRRGRVAAARDVRQPAGGRDRALGPRGPNVRRHAAARRNAGRRPARARGPGPSAGGVLHQVRGARRSARWQAQLDLRHARHGPMAGGQLVASGRRLPADLVPHLVRPTGIGRRPGSEPALRRRARGVDRPHESMARGRPRPGHGVPRSPGRGRGAADVHVRAATAGLHVAGFPVISLRLATSGSDGAIYAYLEDVAPDGTVTYLTEGCLRFLHRATTGPADPAGLGVPRSFARADRLAVEPGQDLDIAVELLPIAALLRTGHKIRVALGGHDAACFDRYGPPDETFTVRLGDHSTLDLPILEPAGTGLWK